MVLLSGFSGWHPKGLLVAHLHEHKAAVNRIRVSDEHSIFATASNDGTVKVWDSQKMEGKTTTTRWVLCLGAAMTGIRNPGNHLVSVLQVRADLLSTRRPREDADLLSRLALFSRGLRQRLHPAAGSRSQ